jgi:hypothetical protein
LASKKWGSASSGRLDALQKLLQEDTSNSSRDLDSGVTDAKKSQQFLKYFKFSIRELVIILVTFLITIAATQFIAPRLGSEVADGIAGKSLAEVTAGGVALTEQELRQAIRLLGVTAYWVGPENGFKYSLESRVNGQVFIKYLPNGQGAEDTNPNYRIVATYALEDAFDSTKAAGSLEGGVGLINPDGAAVYYNRSDSGNAYLAFEGENFQIEIFDPGVSVAVSLATEPMRVKKI